MAAAKDPVAKRAKYQATMAAKRALKNAKPEPKPEPDFEALDDGSTWLFLFPLTDAARAWVDEHIPDDAPWLGSAVAVERRYRGAIIEDAAGDGLRVRVL